MDRPGAAASAAAVLARWLKTQPEALNALHSEIAFLLGVLESPSYAKILKVYDQTCTRSNGDSDVFGGMTPASSTSRAASAVVLEALTRVPNQTARLKTLIRILTSHGFQALFRVHDAVGSTQYPLKAKQRYRGTIKAVQLHDSSTNPLGATIRQDPPTTPDGHRRVVVARVIVGGAADKSGEIFTGDEILEINGTTVVGWSVDEVVDLMAGLEGSVQFKLLTPVEAPTPPASDAVSRASDKPMWIRALCNYDPDTDDFLPCKEGGLPFVVGDVMRIVSQDDPNWWQAAIEGNNAVGLIPGRELQDSRQVAARRSKQQLSYEEVVFCEPHPTFQRPLVLVGPPNVGRNTIKKKLLERYPELYATTIPHTTRSPRGGEVHGREYYFTTPEKMQLDIKNKKFIEHGEYQENLYGTSIQAMLQVMHQGKTCILDVMPKALKHVRTDRLQPMVVFIEPPPLAHLQQTRKSKMSDSKLNKMLATAAKYKQHYGHVFDYTIINEDVGHVVEELHQMVQASREQAQWIPVLWASSPDFGMMEHEEGFGLNH